MKLDARPLPIIVVAMFMAACGGSPSDSPPPASAPSDATSNDVPGLTVDDEDQKDLGLELAPVRSANVGSESRGMATVVDASAFALAMADLESLRSEAIVSSQNERRLEQLYSDDGNASRQAVDAARQQDSASAAKLVSAESRVLLDWGAKLARSTDPDTARLRRDIASGAVTLFRAEFPDSLAQIATQKFSLVSSHHESVVLDYFDRSRAVTQFAAGDSVLLVLRGNSTSGNSYRPGERVPVVATSAGPPQVLVPSDAAIAYQGRLWCYVARDSNRFDRIAIDANSAGAGDYAALEGTKEGDRVVVRGAALLLSLEKSASEEIGASAEE